MEIPIFLTGEDLDLNTLVQVARSVSGNIQLAADAVQRMQASLDWVRRIQKHGTPVVYGINTGFGSKSSVTISRQKLQALQRNLVMSHSAGVGEPFPVEVVRAAMLLRANTLAKGYSGIRPEVVDRLLQMLNRGVTPWVPSQGSLGASGDLAPLAHIAQVLCHSCQESSVVARAFWYDHEEGRWVLLSAREALTRAGIQPIQLEAKEGLALTNGTQISTALLALACNDAINLAKCADIAMAMSLEALQGLSSAFRETLHRLRPHPGQLATAENIRRLVAGSRLLDTKPEKVQDAYSLRCHPQVMAGVRDTLQFVQHTLAIEMNSTNDNPIIFSEAEGGGEAISGGNFHAQPIAFAADYLTIALAEIGSIAERRVFRLSDKNLNEGLPSFLARQSGLESGLMIAQYTAASLVAENRTLCYPASVQSIPTCENQEDHVSMAPVAGRKARQVLQNVQKIVAIELLYAAQALDLRARQQGAQTPLELVGTGTARAYQKVRSVVPFLEQDRPLSPDILLLQELVASGGLVQAVEEVIGPLK
ncbi:MAG: histidine ammonia-lyase [Calditrichaeota bacterium]|nr:MAG: histidine ammonia-lyase [Calditrichota bacterium]